MKQFRTHIVIFIILLMGGINARAQLITNERYVQCNTTHALFVPDNPDYSYEWSMTRGATHVPIVIDSTTNVTENINWDFCNMQYDISVVPILDSVGCKGEPIYMRVHTVDYLSLHALDDVFYVMKDDTLDADVSTNDFDEQGHTLFYTTEPVVTTKHGTLTLDGWGLFTYTPDPGFIGVDTFVYEVSIFINDDPTKTIIMSANAMVAIVVLEPGKNANLYIEKTGPAKALIGGTIEYTIMIRNNGPDAAENVVLRDSLPFGLFNPVYLFSSQSEQPWEGSLNVGNLDNGDSVFVSIIADISQFTPRKTLIFNQGLTWSDSFDPDVTDNDSTWVTEILPLFVDLPDQLLVPGCRPIEMPNLSAGNNTIVKYRWRPATGLSDTTIANPIFTPDEYTVGGIYPYILVVTDELGNVASDTIKLVISDLPMAVIESDTILEGYGKTLFRDLGENLTIDGRLSIPDDLAFRWSAFNNYGIITSQTADTIVVDSLGLYRLKVLDIQDCESVDSVWVLYESHPPVTRRDTISIVAGDTATLNVLINDYDINGFDIHVTEIITNPSHGTFTWDTLGNITYSPNLDSWPYVWDSIEYKVCNNGIPVECNTGWMVIKIIRPPLNADVVIAKSANPIAFWDDTIVYHLLVYNNGPDTANVISIEDQIDPNYLVAPFYRTSSDFGNTWSVWQRWINNRIDITDPVIPVITASGGTEFRVQIKAYIDPRAKINGRFITNKAFIDTDILENDRTNDTSIVVTKIKEKVIAQAGRDTIVGVCQKTVELNGTRSGGENLQFHWTPEYYFDDYESATPTFTPLNEETGWIEIVLTVTDDDGITDSDTLRINVLPPPLADAGPDQFLRVGPGENVSLIGSGSRPMGNALKYFWKAISPNGFVEVGTERFANALADSLGTYLLKVTDAAGCVDYDTMNVYRFYYPPYAIPDYYSTLPNTPVITDNVVYRSLLYNDFDPNGLFEDLLTIQPESKATPHGNVIINSDGSFTYTPAPGFFGVDYFSYILCNQQPDGCSRGYAKITVNNNNDPSRIVNLSIDKMSTSESVLVGKEIEYILKIKNNSSNDQSNITITDSVSTDILIPRYSYTGTPPWNTWTGQSSPFTLSAGDSMLFYIKGTVSPNAEKRIYNAAMVSSVNYDDMFDWDDVVNRNVDTTSVATENFLIAKAELVELMDNDRLDSTIGVCDGVSYLSGKNSSATLGIDAYHWQPSEFLTLGSDTSETAFFNGTASDTTITFTLIVTSGSRSKKASVVVHFSPKVIADAGPDRKKNDGVPLVLDATGSSGANVVYEWWDGDRNYTTSTRLTDFAPDVLHPRIYSPGFYLLYAEDMHGCQDMDTVIITENQVFALNDILEVISGYEVTGNVATNDYDPNPGDSIRFTGVIGTGPFHGTLLDNPIGNNGQNGNNGAKISNDGTYIYRPDPGFIGDDYFTYQVCDDNNPDLCKTATVFIKVLDTDTINSQPVANHDVFFTNKNDTLQGNLIANDYDFDGGILMIDITPVQSAQKGSVTIHADGTFTYIPNLSVVGPDSFYYRIFDNGKPIGYDTAMVSIYIHKIEQENHKPVAVDDAYYVVGKTITGNVMLNDYDPDGNIISFDEFMLTRPTHGTVIFLDQYGSFSYTPYPGFEGTDQLTYEIRESGTIEKYSTTATVYFTCFAEKRYKTDVSITKTGPLEILSGDIIYYTLTATVLGPTLANDVVISDTLSLEHISSSVMYSRNGGADWYRWKDTIRIDRMMLYDTCQIQIRAVLVDTLAGSLSNVGWVSHNMTELDSLNNRSEWITQVYQKVVADAGNDTLIGSCVTEYQLDGTGSLGMGPLQYRWSPAKNLDNASLSKPTYSTTPGTNQLFTLIVSCTYHGFNDSDTATVRVWVANSPVAEAGEEFWDVIGSQVLDGSNSYGDGPLSYLWWYKDDKGKVIVIDSTVSVTVNFSGKYFLTVTDTFGCVAEDFTYVGYKIEPVVAVDDYVETPQDDEVAISILRNDVIDPRDKLNITSVTISRDPLHGTLIWNPSDSTFIYTPELYYVGLDTFYYTIYGLYSNSSSEAMVVINVLNRPAIVPEGFSPNGDGINDFLKIENIEKYPFNNFIIFNRWGNVVYKSDKYSNDEPWDGIANKGIRIGSGRVPAGVYLYILDLGDDQVQQRIVKGNIYVATDNQH